MVKMARNPAFPLAFGLGCLLILIACGASLLFLQGKGGLVSASPGLSQKDSDEVPTVDWEYWQSVNSDIIGWVTVPGTHIDYPVVQARADDPSFYLTHDVYGDWNYTGCPYLDADCERDGLSSRNCVIFGHNLGAEDESLFHDFTGFCDADYARDHSTIVLQTPHWRKELQVEASRVVAGSDACKQIEFAWPEKFASYHAQCVSDSDMILADVSAVARRTQMFTFCTCSYHREADERTLVFAGIAAK